MRIRSEDILYEDKEIVVCRKRAGIAVQTARLGEPDMETELKKYFRAPYMTAVHRLDQPVEGVLVFARTKKAAADLNRQSREQAMNKQYYAVVLFEGEEAPEGKNTLADYLERDGKTNISKVTGEGNGKYAELSYEILKKRKAEEGEPETALARIWLKTGRHHQISVQMANAGMPLLGDVKYGSERSKEYSRRERVRNTALCAYGLEFGHPGTGKKMRFDIMPSEAVFLPFLPVNT